MDPVEVEGMEQTEGAEKVLAAAVVEDIVEQEEPHPWVQAIMLAEAEAGILEREEKEVRLVPQESVAEAEAEVSTLLALEVREFVQLFIPLEVG